MPLTLVDTHSPEAHTPGRDGTGGAAGVEGDAEHRRLRGDEGGRQGGSPPRAAAAPLEDSATQRQPGKAPSVRNWRPPRGGRGGKGAGEGPHRATAGRRGTEGDAEHRRPHGGKGGS